jgi:hypothetical protein
MTSLVRLVPRGNREATDFSPPFSDPLSVQFGHGARGSCTNCADWISEPKFLHAAVNSGERQNGVALAMRPPVANKEIYAKTRNSYRKFDVFRGLCVHEQQSDRRHFRQHWHKCDNDGYHHVWNGWNIRLRIWIDGGRSHNKQPWL